MSFNADDAVRALVDEARRPSGGFSIGLGAEPAGRIVSQIPLGS